jgi:outer membrane lipoprotein SlyB
METQPNRFPQSLMWIAGIAITLFCAAGIAAIMGWIPTSMGRSGDPIPLAAVEAPKAPAAVPVPAKTYQAPPPPVAHSAPRTHAPPAQVASVTPARVRCSECGVIESSQEVAMKGKGTGLGAVGGAVVGGLLGNQVGNGRGQTIATVVGAVGGGVAGNEVEKRVKTTKSYEVTVRMEDGSSRVISESTAPWRTGDRVKVVDGVIRSN